MSDQPSPLRYCLNCGPSSWATAQGRGDADRLRAAVDRTVELGRIADEAGIDALFALEDPDGWDAFGALNAIARVTGRVRLGTGVINPYYRHQAQMAASLATLDLMSNGRAFLGLGRGQTEWYREGMGMPAGKPVAKLVETIDLLRQWFRPPYQATSPERATEFGLNHWRRVLHPVQTHLPIYLAAVGPRSMRVAARHADGVIFNDLASREFMADSIRTVRDEAARAGRDATRFEFYARASVTITDDPEAVYQKRKDIVAMIHTLPGMERLLQTEGFDTDRIIADVRKVMRTNEVLDRGGAFVDLKEAGDLETARRLIPDALMRELTVAGPVATVREQLRALRDIGVTHVFLAPPGRQATAETLRETIAAIA